MDPVFEKIISSYSDVVSAYFDNLKDTGSVFYGLPPINQTYILDIESVEYEEDADTLYHIHMRLTEEYYKDMVLSRMITAKSIRKQLEDRIQKLWAYEEEFTFSDIVVKSKYVDIFYSINYISEESQTLTEKLPEDVIQYHIIPNMDLCQLKNLSAIDKNIYSFIYGNPEYKKRLYAFNVVYNFILNGKELDDTQIDKWLHDLKTKKIGKEKNKIIDVVHGNIQKLIMIMRKLYGLDGSVYVYKSEGNKYYPGPKYDMYTGIRGYASYLNFIILSDYLEYDITDKFVDSVFVNKTKEYNDEILDTDKYNCIAIAHMMQVAENFLYTYVLNYAYRIFTRERIVSPVYVKNTKLYKSMNYRIFFELMNNDDISEHNKKLLTFDMSEDILQYIKTRKIKSKIKQKEWNQLLGKYKEIYAELKITKE